MADARSVISILAVLADRDGFREATKMVCTLFQSSRSLRTATGGGASREQARDISILAVLADRDGAPVDGHA